MEHMEFFMCAIWNESATWIKHDRRAAHVGMGRKGQESTPHRRFCPRHRFLFVLCEGSWFKILSFDSEMKYYISIIFYKKIKLEFLKFRWRYNTNTLFFEFNSLWDALNLFIQTFYLTVISHVIFFKTFIQINESNIYETVSFDSVPLTRSPYQQNVCRV